MFKIYKVGFLLLITVTLIVAPKRGPRKEDRRRLLTEARERENKYRQKKAFQELERLTTIRIFIPNAPNFGHQSAAIALLDQLTEELHYKGDIEVVYEETVRQRLQTLRPGFEDLSGRIKFIAQGDFKGVFQKDGLAFSAGSESVCDEGNTGKLLDSMRVPCGVFLQPYAWKSGERCLACKDPPKEAGKIVVEKPLLPESSTYIYQVKFDGDLNKLFKHNVFSNDAVQESETEKYKIIQYILNKVLNEEEELMVLYGIHQVYWERENVLVNLQGGVQEAKLPKPSVLLLFGKNIIKPRAKSIVQTIDKVKTETIDMFLNGKGNGRQITILGGQVIQPIFHLACKLSTLPMVFEGANTANLAYLLKKPFISVKDAATPLPVVNKGTGRKMLKELVKHIKNDISWTKRNKQLEEYAKMLINLRRARHFVDSQQGPTKPLNVLQNVIKYISTGNEEVLNNFIEDIKWRIDWYMGSKELAKEIFLDKLYNAHVEMRMEEKYILKIEKLLKQLKSNIVYYRAEFQRAPGLEKLTEAEIKSEGIYDPPEIAESEVVQDMVNQDIKEIVKQLKDMEFEILGNSLDAYNQEIDPFDPGNLIQVNVGPMVAMSAKMELEPSAEAVNDVKKVIIESKKKGSNLNKYYENVFKIPREIENNQVVQSLYLISTMETSSNLHFVKRVGSTMQGYYVRLQNFQKDSKKLGLSKTVKSKVSSIIEQYESTTRPVKKLRDRFFCIIGVAQNDAREFP